MEVNDSQKKDMPFINLNRRKPRNASPTKRAHQRYYQDKRYKRLRALKLATDPLCERCDEVDRVTPGVEVHHITPITTGQTDEERERLAFDLDNLESLCYPCHQARHIELEKNNKKY